MAALRRRDSPPGNGVPDDWRDAFEPLLEAMLAFSSCSARYTRKDGSEVVCENTRANHGDLHRTSKSETGALPAWARERRGGGW